MISIDCPDVDFRAFYQRTVSRTTDNALRKRLSDETDRVVMRSDSYVELAGTASLHEFHEDAPLHAEPDELERVYDRVLVNGGERSTYDRVRASARLQICPMCAARFVKTVDHLLPKSVFPELAAFERNLVPCCSDCNKTKDDSHPNDAESQFFHPYFDNWEKWEFLLADVSINGAVNVNFRVFQANGMPELEFGRARFHFDALELGTLYSGLSAVELVDQKGAFSDHFADGVKSLRDELTFLANSAAQRHLNNWRAALYRGLAACDEFVEGGFKLIPE